MAEFIVDEVVGGLHFREDWVSENAFMVGENTVYIVFQGSERETLTDGQRVAYLYAVEHLEDLLKAAVASLNELPEDVLESLIFVSLYFRRNGQYGFLIECEGFEDDGLAIVFNNKGEIVDIGGHDLLI